MDHADFPNPVPFQQLAPTEPLQFYLSKTVRNSFYHAGELVAQLSAINLMKPPPAGPNDSRSAEARAFNALCTEIIEVSRDVTELFGSLIGMLGDGTPLRTQPRPDSKVWLWDWMGRARSRLLFWSG